MKDQIKPPAETDLLSLARLDFAAFCVAVR
jgi:hypothetical protein